MCLCEYKGPAGVPCDKVPSPKCVHTKCVAAAKEKAKGKKGKKGDHKGSLVEVNFSSRDELQSTLPQEWEQHTDDSGLPYYYNTFTRVTSWTRPAANHC